MDADLQVNRNTGISKHRHSFKRKKWVCRRLKFCWSFWQFWCLCSHPMILANNNTGLNSQLQTHFSGWGDGHPLRPLLTLCVNPSLCKSADKSSCVSDSLFMASGTRPGPTPNIPLASQANVIGTTCWWVCILWAVLYCFYLRQMHERRFDWHPISSTHLV